MYDLTNMKKIAFDSKKELSSQLRDNESSKARSDLIYNYTHRLCFS